MSDLSSQEPDLRMGQLGKKRRVAKIKPSCDIFVAQRGLFCFDFLYISGRNIDRQNRNIQYVTQHLIITSAFYANNVCVKKNRKKGASENYFEI